MDALLRELDAFLDEPRADEILLGEWLHDKTLPIPSPELLEFFAIELLLGFGKYLRYFVAGNDGTKEAVSQFVAEMKLLPTGPKRKLVSYAVARINLLSIGGIKGHVAYWWTCIAGLNMESELGVTINAGERRMTRLLIESMTLRAIFTNDVPRLEGLVKAVRADRDKEEFKTKNSEQIAFQIIRWHPYLAEKLGRRPQQSEMKVFLLEACQGSLKDHDSHWADAAKLARFYPEDGKRKRRADDSLLVKLGLEARGKEPKVKRVSSWRQPPKFEHEEDLQK